MARTKAKGKYVRRTPAKTIRDLATKVADAQGIPFPPKQKVTVTGELTVTQAAIDKNLSDAIVSLSSTITANAETIRRGQDSAHNNAEALRNLVNVLHIRMSPVAVGVAIDGQTYFPPKADKQVS